MSRLGVLGGMGPSATVDFMDKVVQLTPASCDQEHLPMIVANLPQVPDRSRAILGVGPDPLPALLAGIDVLNQIGVGVVAIPCNSSHHWYAQMAAHSQAPVLHIAQACVDRLSTLPQVRSVAILATRGALASGFYQQALDARGVAYVLPESLGAQDDVDACIRAVKGGDLAVGTHALRQVLAALGEGVDAAIMGCTEIPIAARGLGEADMRMVLLDSSLELARATVAYALAQGWNRSA